MSPHGINSLVGDLVEMAKATERLPQLEAELDRANTSIERYAKQVQDREIAIISYKEEIEALHAKVRSLEVERDDASFRVLEAEDQALASLGLVKSARITMESVIAILDPPKPEPVKEDMVALEAQAVPLGQSETPPTTSSENTSTASGEALSSVPEAVHSISELPGQSESSPMTNANAGEGRLEQTSVISTANDTATSAEPTNGPYFGKSYYNMPQFIHYNDWIAGGGTDYDYFNRW